MLTDATTESDDVPDVAPEPATEPRRGPGRPAPSPRTARVAVPAQRKVSQPATGPLAGSALSPATWSKALDAVREMTVRK